MRVIKRPFSEFLRQPNDVVAELADHDVVLRRRNAPSLRLSEADRDDKRSEAFEALARLLQHDGFSYDRSVAAEHAELLVAVRQAGPPRGAHDLIIAATARASKRTVVTSDLAAFHDLPGVTVLHHR